MCSIYSLSPVYNLNDFNFRALNMITPHLCEGKSHINLQQHDT